MRYHVASTGARALRLVSGEKKREGIGALEGGGGGGETGSAARRRWEGITESGKEGVRKKSFRSMRGRFLMASLVFENKENV